MSKDKKVMKPVYFNSANVREKEMLEWLDSKFSSFGGMVKDLLYQEMLREKGGIMIQRIEVSKDSAVTPIVEDNTEENHIVSKVEEFANKADVDDFEC